MRLTGSLRPNPGIGDGRQAIISSRIYRRPPLLPVNLSSSFATAGPGAGHVYGTVTTGRVSLGHSPQTRLAFARLRPYDRSIVRAFAWEATGA
jgi:hypothetical protein